MTKELRDAAELWLSYPDDESSVYDQAGTKLAKAWIAANPADDEEPITLGWLRSIGFVRHMQTAASNDLSITCGKSSLCLHEKWVWSCYSASQLPAYIPAALAPKNRGQVRYLCSVLGIELQEKK